MAEKNLQPLSLPRKNRGRKKNRAVKNLVAGVIRKAKKAVVEDGAAETKVVGDAADSKLLKKVKLVQNVNRIQIGHN